MKNALFVALILFSVGLSFGQSNQTDSLTTPQKKIKKVDFSVMPFVSYNRNLEFMFGAIPMMMYKLNKEDNTSPKSLTGLSAVYTTNSSYFLAFFNQFYFKEDTWRGKLFAVHGDNNSQFYMEGIEASGFYDYGTLTTIISAGIQRKVIDKLYVGLTYTFAHYDTEYENEVLPQSTTQTNALEINALYDGRNAVYYPTKGEKAQFKFISFPTWFGNDVQANKIVSEYNKYFSMKNERDVVAARFAGKFGLGDIAFEQQQTLGGKDIRGYSEGKYRGEGLMAIQGEYRLNFHKKMGIVGFAGLATIYGSSNDDFNWKAYPGIGLGYRYKAFKTVNFNIGLDAAVGKDDWGIYFRIGEAF
ncbi:BamA/TamA family outer membrane protein [Mangrovimonas spongiae]|uniref:Bacterial surface antigen (D15) domain-containing protein n=1 Tax=Mangrovimonas spongiae TaxID=2494697 RepID=A0A428K1I9_9FLAO|nr:BamA/TamA family outer membrane protein [Mangrovimonas spongiae]RSK40223.1 hypothetical protein EJA19_04390 [Mangrovimonas spongiae]